MQEKGGDIMNFAERLRQARIKRGYTQQQIADKMGITNSTYCGYETGKRQPDVAKIKQLANILNVSGDELLGTEFINDKIELLPREQSHIKKYRQLNADGQSKVDEYTTDLVDSGKYAAVEQPVIDIEYTEMPVYNEPAAAGIGNYLQDSTYEMMSFPADSIPAGTDFGIRISGDSMEPIIKDGSIIWVKQQIEIENGEVGIFVLNNDAYCKRLHIDYDKKIVELISDNTNYKPIVIKTIDSLRTVGKVLFNKVR